MKLIYKIKSSCPIYKLYC